MTGAAGVLDGGWVGGANVCGGCELTPRGWLDAGGLAWLVAGAPAFAVGEVAMLAWPGMACAKAAARAAVAPVAAAVMASENDLVRLNKRRR